MGVNEDVIEGYPGKNEYLLLRSAHKFMVVYQFSNYISNRTGLFLLNYQIWK